MWGIVLAFLLFCLSFFWLLTSRAIHGKNTALWQCHAAKAKKIEFALLDLWKNALHHWIPHTLKCLFSPLNKLLILHGHPCCAPMYTRELEYRIRDTPCYNRYECISMKEGYRHNSKHSTCYFYLLGYCIEESLGPAKPGWQDGFWVLASWRPCFYREWLSKNKTPRNILKIKSQFSKCTPERRCLLQVRVVERCNVPVDVLLRGQKLFVNENLPYKYNTSPLGCSSDTPEKREKAIDLPTFKESRDALPQIACLLWWGAMCQSASRDSLSIYRYIAPFDNPYERF